MNRTIPSNVVHSFFGMLQTLQFTTWPDRYCCSANVQNVLQHWSTEDKSYNLKVVATGLTQHWRKIKIRQSSFANYLGTCFVTDDVYYLTADPLTMETVRPDVKLNFPKNWPKYSHSRFHLKFSKFHQKF